jgi:hypothetical protein
MLADSQVVELSVPSASGLTLTFVEKGLHITSIKFKDSKGEEHDIIIGSDDPAHYVDQKAVRPIRHEYNGIEENIDGSTDTVWSADTPIVFPPRNH